MKNEPTIRVGILAATIIEFELKNEFLCDGDAISAGAYTATLENGLIHCSNSNNVSKVLFQNQIVLTPISPSSLFVLRNVTIGIGFHWEQQEDQEFEGGLTLQVESGKIRAVNTILLESYLGSVISSEMSAMNDINLLNAHAIVSRSWLLAQLQNKGNCNPDEPSHVTRENKIFTREEIFPHSAGHSGMTSHYNEIIKWYDRENHATFDVCADDHCQRYQGVTKVISANARKAIENTRGKVLMYNNEICDARYSKCCGGISEDFENVWQPKKVPYLVAIRDNEPKMFIRTAHYETDYFFTTAPEAYCNTSDPEILSQVLIDFDRKTTNFYRWKVEYSQAELAALIMKKSEIDFGDIIDLIPLERGNSGRIILLKIIGTKREVIVGKELEIRKWLSESHLYSSAFVVKKNFDKDSHVPSQFILLGAGWGHGVGMCQIGAAVMSQKGNTAFQILEHYYKGALVAKIYE